MHGIFAGWKSASHPLARDGVIRRWEVGTGKEIDPPTGHTGPDRDAPVRAGWQDSPLARLDGKRHGVGRAEGARELHLIRRFTEHLIQRFTGNTWGGVVLPRTFPRTVRSWPLLIGVTSSLMPSVLWDTRAGKELRTLTIDKGGMRWRKCVFSPDGKLLAAQGKNGIRLWHVASGNVLHDLPGPPGYVAFSPDGTRLATAGQSDKDICLWDVSTGKETHRWDSGQGPNRSLYFLMGGKWLASAHAESLRVWEAQSGKQLLHLAEGVHLGNTRAVEPMGFSIFAERPSHSRGRARARWWSNDEFYESGTIRLLDLYSGEEIRRFDVPQGDVSALAFAPDGRTLASGGRDSTILLWDMTDQSPGDKGRAGLLAARELDELWSDLAGDAPKAERALWRLARAPKQSLPFLKDRLRSVVLQPELVAKLLTDLDSEQYPVRQKATKALDELGEAAEGAVHKMLDSNPTLETQKRLEQFLEKRKKEMIRKLRAIEALEQIGTLERAAAFGRPGERDTQSTGGTISRRGSSSPHDTNTRDALTAANMQVLVWKPCAPAGRLWYWSGSALRRLRGFWSHGW